MCHDRTGKSLFFDPRGAPFSGLRACLKFPLRVHWLGKWTDAMTQIRSIFRNMLEI
jgi:hypothetical protein